MHKSNPTRHLCVFRWAYALRIVGGTLALAIFRLSESMCGRLGDYGGGIARLSIICKIPEHVFGWNNLRCIYWFGFQSGIMTIDLNISTRARAQRVVCEICGACVCRVTWFALHAFIHIHINVDHEWLFFFSSVGFNSRCAYNSTPVLFFF